MAAGGGSNVWYVVPPRAMDPLRSRLCRCMWSSVRQCVDWDREIHEEVFVRAVHILDMVLDSWLEPEPVRSKPGLGLVGAASVLLSAKLTCADPRCNERALLDSLETWGYTSHTRKQLWETESDIFLARCRGGLGFECVVSRFLLRQGASASLVRCAGETMVAVEGSKPFPVVWVEEPDEASGEVPGEAPSEPQSFEIFAAATTNRFELLSGLDGSRRGLFDVRELRYAAAFACHVVMDPELLRSVEDRSYVADVVFAFRESSDIERAVSTIFARVPAAGSPKRRRAEKPVSAARKRICAGDARAPR